MTQAGNRSDPSSWPAGLRRAMASIPESRSLCVALSGGLDSVFLLHAVAGWFAGRADVQVGALHINHGLQAAADDMEALCRRLCADLGVELTVARVAVDTGRDSLENTAREARYGAFARHLAAGQILLQAHHANDQAETVLFRLVRGSGVRGLAGIPAARTLGAASVFRPLLPIARAELESWALAWGLDWFDDPTNSDTRIDRNYLRHRVLAPLLERWPGALATLARSARQSAEADRLAARLAALQRDTVEDGQGRLSAPELVRMALCERKNLLRWWLIDRGFEPPAASRLEQGLQDLLQAGEDRVPALVGTGYRVLRYQGRLYCVADRPTPPLEPLPWHTAEPLVWAGGRLSVSGADPGLRLTVTARRGGERLRPVASGGSRPLKKWLQEQGVPPWERERIPLLWKDGELVAVAGLWVSPSLRDASESASWRIVWDGDCR